MNVMDRGSSSVVVAYLSSKLGLLTTGIGVVGGSRGAVWMIVAGRGRGGGRLGRGGR